jgi:Putative prokaryotic signal transducing protein
MNDIVCVATFNQSAEAEVALAFLEGQGIPATLDIPNAGRLQPGIAWVSGGIKLTVPKADAERARQLLDSGANAV